ncbi:uncharacterized protein [Dysidea avara]|uniref:uncharacterized protein n=1 Tax=Dysidea avara TaxID=196820 RepID=UPI00332A5010
MSSVEKVHPLASKPLCTPHFYDTNFQVCVQLNQPLWLKRPSPQELAMQMAAFCVQLDSLVASTFFQSVDQSSSKENANRRVSFEHGFSSKAMSIYEKMNDTLLKAGVQTDAQDYLKMTGLHQLFPRVLEHLKDPNEPVVDIVSPELDAYFSHITCLNNLLSMSQQLISEIQGADSHKYMAYETALLHQCVNSVGPGLSNYKKEIEAQFQALKASCAVTDDEPKPRLSEDLEQWLEEITERLSGEATSLRPEFITPFKPLLKLVHNVPGYE